MIQFNTVDIETIRLIENNELTATPIGSRMYIKGTREGSIVIMFNGNYIALLDLLT